MTRARLAWGGAAAAIVALGALSIGVAIATTAGPEHHVQRYLDALARDDLTSAARLAGLELDGPLPVGDDGEPSIHRVIDAVSTADGSVAITAEYGDAADAALVTFHLEPAPATLGVIPAWRFREPPVFLLAAGVDQHDRVSVGTTTATATEPGAIARVAVFVPARVTVRIAEPLLTAEPVTLRVSGQSGTPGSPEAPVVLIARPAPALERDVRAQLEDLLATCAEQPVLKPAACPFGIEIDDRVTEGPAWAIDELGPVSISAGGNPGRWRVNATGSATAAITVQRLFDGTVSERSETVSFVVSGVVELTDGEPRLTLDPAAP